jgi:hypothetical protein
MPGRGEGQGLVAGVRGQDLVAVHRQATAQDIDIHRLIIHDEETGRGVHQGPPARVTDGTYGR